MHPNRFFIAVLLIAVAIPYPISAARKSKFDMAAYLSRHDYHAVVLHKLKSKHESVGIEINGVRGLFILDSGAGASVVNKASMAKFGLQTTVGPARTATGAGGNFSTNRYSVTKFKIDDVDLPVESIAVGDLSGVVNALQAHNSVAIDGVIGQDILTQFGGIIDVGGQRLFVRKLAS